jgi:hypothetical protein
MLNAVNVGSCSNTCYIKHTYSFEHIHAIYYIKYKELLSYIMFWEEKGEIHYYSWPTLPRKRVVQTNLDNPVIRYVYVNVANSEDDNKTFNLSI